MGALYAFDLQPFIDSYGLKYYFETGTGKGDCLIHALSYPFEFYYSVDIDEDLVNESNRRIARERPEKLNKVLIQNMKSKDFIREWLPSIPNEPTLFFLDAHFPGADFHKISYEESIRTYRQDAFPLEEEINLILELRNISQDVIIADDFFLYEKGDYEAFKQGMTWNYDELRTELGLQSQPGFLYDIFLGTHKFHIDFRHQGYFIAVPKGDLSI